jgi:L-seryl-tRNA(Ser) seleniumtransferase
MRTGEELLDRAEALAAAIGHDLAQAVRSTAAVGGGGAPGVALPSAAVAVPAWLAAPLRVGDTPVVGHTEGGRLLLDLISVPPELDPVLADAVRRAAKATEATRESVTRGSEGAEG